jgi:hypothetical protein
MVSVSYTAKASGAEEIARTGQQSFHQPTVNSPHEVHALQAVTTALRGVAADLDDLYPLLRPRQTGRLAASWGG